METFSGLNFYSFNPIKFSWKYLVVSCCWPDVLTIKYNYMHLSSCIHAFHEYQAIWEPTCGELYYSIEISNANDPYAISVMKGRDVISNKPYKIFRMCAIYMRNGLSVKWAVTWMHHCSCDIHSPGDILKQCHTSSFNYSTEQVDILISKNQALHLKHHVYKLSWIRNSMKAMKIWYPCKLTTYHTYTTLSMPQLSYQFPSWIVNSWYTSSCELGN